MTTKTGAQIQADFRARRAAQGLTEVRGIFLPPSQHREFKIFGKIWLNPNYYEPEQLSKQEQK